MLMRGVTAFREGERADRIFLLESGLVKLSRDFDPQRQMIIRLVRPGELIGDRAVSAIDAYRYTAEALMDSSYWEVGREQFQTACSQSAEVLGWVTAQVEQRLLEVEKRIELISFARVEYRLLTLLADLAGAANSSNNSGSFPLSQSEIAQLIGATRETASTILNQFERRGLVRLGRRQVEVLNLPGVRDALTQTARAATAQE